MNLDFSSVRITIVGDAIEDQWIYGRVERLSPEGPWPIFLPEKTVTKPGGAANVGANLAAIGCPYALLAPLRMPIKQRHIAGRQHLLRIDIENTHPITEREEDDLFEKACNTRPEVLVLSDYGKGCFGRTLAQRLISWARKRGIVTIVDPKGGWDRYIGATVITPNMHEVPRGMEGCQTNEVIGRYDLTAILVTQGENGMTLVDIGGTHHIPARGPSVVDAVGAGDTVVAVLAAGLGKYMPMIEAARMANAAAGVVVGKPGTAVCTRDELLAAYSGKPAVGLANGCFDTLHAGHVQLLREASSRVDRLIVALNSDESVRRLKGPARPVNDIATRTLMLQSLKFVAEVRIFDTEDELRQIIQETGATLLFKGIEYEGCRVTGDDIVKEVVLIDTPTKSSTAAEVTKRTGVWA